MSRGRLLKIKIQSHVIHSQNETSSTSQTTGDLQAEITE